MRSDETVQERNMRMGGGCKCRGETFCPDEICIGYVADVPVYVKRDSPEGQQAMAERAAKRKKDEDVLLAHADRIRAERAANRK